MKAGFLMAESRLKKTKSMRVTSTKSKFFVFTQAAKPESK